MNWDTIVRGIIDTAIFSMVGIIMMAVGFFLVCLITPFSIKKEIEDDQNIALGIIIGAVILGISIIIASVILSPSSNQQQRVEPPVQQNVIQDKDAKQK